ncbi:unnamed protein product [Prorocentrum cordatum]|uniref:Glycosyl transferase CAP10 domain-containing protein n=1 Tax=Prorocentrum cordatum TaxID=2364126 RepID=A0ABN9T3I3_9DINO|nr:unnamed protein product [Polarella glacialis]
MKVAAALLWVSLERGMTLTTRDATETSVSVNASPDEPETYDPEDIEVREWMGADGMAIIEKEIAAGHAALSTSLQAIDRLFGARQSGVSPTPISTICETIGVKTQACGRVGEYLGRLANVDTRVSVKVPKFAAYVPCDVLFATSLRKLCELPANGPSLVYRADICKALASAPHVIGEGHALFKFGDRRDASACFPTFYKTRLMKKRDDNYVLLDLNHGRHWGPMNKVADADIPWASKSATLVWRGVSTGTCDTGAVNSRMMLCNKWYSSTDSRIDVGITAVAQNCNLAGRYMKPAKSMEQLLTTKYHLLVNGNDKPSGLNWVLLSNSVPFMVEPDIESWLLEASLKPWEHYIPIKPDFSDLSEKVDWAVQNDGEAERIAKAGKEYVQQFGTTEEEMAVQAAALA